MALNELAATAAARPRTTPRGLVANATANNAELFAKQDAADVREWGEVLKRLGHIK